MRERRNISRTLVLTNWRQNGRYAGAEAMRRILREMPAESVRWAALNSSDVDSVAGGVACKGVERKPMHWRLRGSALDMTLRCEVQARRMADSVEAWVTDFCPEQLWVLPEAAAVRVGTMLQRRLKIPMHATVYDAPETAKVAARTGIYYPLHIRRVREFYRQTSSVDSVSDSLISHLKKGFIAGDCRTTVFPVSVSESWMRKVGVCSFYGRNDPVRKLGFCGAFRISDGEWMRFLSMLARMPYKIEFVAFAERDSVPRVEVPENVAFDFQPYVEDEEEIVRCFLRKGVDACYLGLSHDKNRRLFAQTSLSSKLTTYAATGLPLIVDAPADSAAWKLIEPYDAGVLCRWGTEAERASTEMALHRMFESEERWQQYANGTARLAREVFSMEKNLPKLLSTMRGNSH